MILEKVSEYDIFRHYFGDFEVGKPFNSPFRKDDNPSFEVNQLRNGRLMYIDYGDGNRSPGGITDMLRKFYPGRKFNELLEILDKDMGLGFTTGVQTRRMEKTLIRFDPKKEVDIKVSPRKHFNKEELNYWNEYYIDSLDLQREGWHPIRNLYIDGIKRNLQGLTFAILFAGKYWKIYSPFADKKHKWLSNVPHSLMYGLENFEPKPSMGIITKASKDYMITRKFFPYVAGVQSESPSAISDENLEYIRSHVKFPFINFDPDEAGRKAAKFYHGQGFNDLCTPAEWFERGIKDNADIIKAFGPERFEKYLKDSLYEF